MKTIRKMRYKFIQVPYVHVSTITGKLPVLELALPFPVMVPLPEVGNPNFRYIQRLHTIHFFLFLARAPVQSLTCALFYKMTLT